MERWGQAIEAQCLLQQLPEIFLRRSGPQRALDELRLLQQEFERCGNVDHAVRAQMNQAFALATLGRYDESRKLLLKQVDWWRSIGSLFDVQSCLGNLANTCAFQGQLREALKLHIEEENILPAARRRRIATVPFDSGPISADNAANGCNQLGAHHVFVQDFEKAIETLRAALNKLAAVRASSRTNRSILGEIATAHFNLGDLYSTLHRRSGSQADRENSIRHDQPSIAADRFLNADVSRTEKRLKSP